MYFIRICINIHFHEKKIQIRINLFFSKNDTPPSYKNKIQPLYDKYLQFGHFCFFMCLPKNTKYNSMEKSSKLGQLTKNRQITYVTVRGPLFDIYITYTFFLRVIFYILLTFSYDVNRFRDVMSSARVSRRHTVLKGNTSLLWEEIFPPWNYKFHFPEKLLMKKKKKKKKKKKQKKKKNQQTFPMFNIVIYCQVL